jgi:ATP-dependent RNA helicase SUPV3L1/SUV3
MLAAGRTSVVADSSFERTFYKLAGFRYLGKRAVRIDILERLADLIRPLLQWKPGTTPRPDGAYDGRRFTATTSMLSILGATPDDMEEILKGLGYRADSVTAEEAAAFLAKQNATPNEASATPEAAAEHIEADADAAEPSDADATAADTAPTEAASTEPSGDETPVAAQPEEPSEPKPVLLWRPGTRQDNQRGGRHQGDQRRGGQRHGQGEAREGGRKGGAPARGKPQDGKPGGQRKERQDRHERHERHDRAPGKFDSRPPRKEKPIDPDSPFAKLAALKEQLKK